MPYLGSWQINDYLTFYHNTHNPGTGAAVDADAVPSYRIYEDETGTAIATGTMALLDAGNTVGFYSERLRLLAATGLETGKQYSVYITATVTGVEATTHHTFRVEDSTADQVWDEILTSGSHNVGYSAGQRLRYLILSGAIAQDASVDTITLATTESDEDDIHTQNIISIVSGTGAGQTRLIIEYDGESRVATVGRPWAIQPDATSVYELLPNAATLLAAHGTAMAGAASTITLGPTALTDINSYVGCAIYIGAGTGRGQTRLITEYTAGRVATVSPAWEIPPDATSVYKVIPIGRAIIESFGIDATGQVRDAILDDATRFSGASIAAILEDTETDGVVLSVAMQRAIADQVLARGVDNVEATADGTSLAELLLAAFESAMESGTWTIYQTDHATVFATRTVTTDPDAAPIVEVT